MKSTLEEQCPDDLLENRDAVRLNRWLPRFVAECCWEDEKPYQPSSICNILAGLYRYSRKSVSEGGSCPNLMNSKDPLFRDLNGAIQVQLREEGIGEYIQHTSIVTPNEEHICGSHK